VWHRVIIDVWGTCSHSISIYAVVMLAMST